MKQIKHCNTETLSRALHKLAKQVLQKRTLPRRPSHPKKEHPEPHIIFLHHNVLVCLKMKLQHGGLIKFCPIRPQLNLLQTCPGQCRFLRDSQPPIQPQTPLRNSHKPPWRKPEVRTSTSQNFQNRNTWKARRKKKNYSQKILFSPPQTASHPPFSPFQSPSTLPFPVNPHKYNWFPSYKGIFSSSRFLWLCYRKALCRAARHHLMSQTDEPVLLQRRRSNNYTQVATACEEGKESRSDLTTPRLRWGSPNAFSYSHLRNTITIITARQAKEAAQ